MTGFDRRPSQASSSPIEKVKATSELNNFLQKTMKNKYDLEMVMFNLKIKEKEKEKKEMSLIQMYKPLVN